MFKKITTSLLFLFAISLFFPSISKAEGKIYLIEINYNKGNVNFGEVSTKLGYATEPEKPDFMEKDKYWIELVSFSGKILEKRMFSIPLEIFQEPPLEGSVSSEKGPIILEQVKSLITLPYYKEGKTLNLYDEKMKFIEKKDISYLADLCGNKICEEHENQKSCSIDCVEPAKEKTSLFFYSFIGIAVTVLLVFVIRVLLSRNKPSRP